MGQLIKNKHLNYWVCGIIFTLLAGVVGFVLGWIINLGELLGAAVGLVLTIILLPYVLGRLVDFVSDSWMD